MNIKQELISLARQLEDENEEAFMLWTWLPSHQVAKKYHGDYADTFQPSNAEIMKEANLYIYCLADHVKLNQKDMDDHPIFTECPCGNHCELENTKE